LQLGKQKRASLRVSSAAARALAHTMCHQSGLYSYDESPARRDGTCAGASRALAEPIVRASSARSQRPAITGAHGRHTRVLPPAGALSGRPYCSARMQAGLPVCCACICIRRNPTRGAHVRCLATKLGTTPGATHATHPASPPRSPQAPPRTQQAQAVARLDPALVLASPRGATPRCTSLRLGS